MPDPGTSGVTAPQGAVLLQFCTQQDLGSWAIRTFERGVDGGLWSHVDAVLADGRLLGARDDVCAGVARGVQIRPAAYAPFTKTKLVRIPCPQAIADAYYAFLEQQLGKPYDELAIAAFVVDRDWRQANAWFCDELQAAAGEAAMLIAHKLAVPDNRLTPDGLYLVLSALTDIDA